MPQRFSIVTPLLCVACILSSFSLRAGEVPKYSPKDSKLEIDNEWVRVLRVRQWPGERVTTYAHPDTVRVYLTDAQIRFKAGKETTIEARKAGDVGYLAAGAHSEENLGHTPLEVVVIELKPGAPKSEAIHLDPTKLDGQHHPVLLENDRVRILRTILEPHLKSPEHEHPHYVVVYLTELHTNMKLADGTMIDNVRRPGEVAWRDALKHVTENVDPQTAMEIQVEIK